ncbi:MAG: GNAT family N-acetyltransferase [bacterium]|nr:GNAT family N-acetyltransferase [bacterium]MCP5030472.1 GNAT family N-acetyltransferase [Actinomycetes bacterium]
MAEIRYAQIAPEHAEGLVGVEHASFPGLSGFDLLGEHDIHRYCEVFPEGGFVALDGGRPVAMGLGIFVDFDFSNPNHTLEQVSGDQQCGNHDPEGDWYYGINISVHPDYRGRGIGRELYGLRKQVCRHFNRKGIVAGGVIPGYADRIRDMSCVDYIEGVVAGDLYDPTLTFQLENGFRAVAPLPDYMEDEAVGNWAVLIAWDNPDHVEAPRPSLPDEKQMEL